MLRRFVSAMVVMVLIAGVGMADTVRGIITKVETEKDKDAKITITPFVKKEKGEPRTIVVAKDAKVFKAKGKDDKEDAKLSDIADLIEKATGKFKGVFASVETKGEKDEERATEITFRVFKKKKKVDD